MRKANWTAGLAACGALLALMGGPARAQQVDVLVLARPPAPRAEVIPKLQPGHAWVAGHWKWHRYGYVWVPGHRVAARTGQWYEAPRWVRYGNRWGYHAGGWRRR